MVVRIKNQKVYASTFKKIDAYNKKAISEYNKGNLKEGDKYADKSDAVYNKNYDKMFEVVSNEGVKEKYSKKQEMRDEYWKRPATTRARELDRELTVRHKISSGEIK